MEINASNNNNSRSKKRKISSGKEHDEEVVEDQELEDEAKMKIFFSLVRNIRESRDRWINFRSGHEDNNKNKGVCRNNIIAGKEEEEEEKTVAAEVVWKPTFQLEDFAEEKALPFVASGSYNNNNNRDKEEDAEKGIDLRLSL
ncbi:hypothetical protein RIF29_22306 [Crotalaria pallida]|uniref:Uncharacterized protein n=1 Tax=Crotalaria pallida TaxID=3830 RepID=A0AAN9I994_CROPI